MNSVQAAKDHPSSLLSTARAPGQLCGLRPWRVAAKRLKAEFDSVRFGAVRWAGKGFWAVLDQGLFSGANIVVNILLARWLAPEEYGAFAVALSIYYFLMGFHTAVLTEPMMVFGAGKYREKFQKYLGMLLYGHWGISAVIALLLGVAALVVARLGSLPMAQALMGLALASPFLLFLWLTRRACYTQLKPAWAAAGSGANLVFVLTGVYLLWRAGMFSSLSGLLVLGAAAVIASLLVMVPLQPQLFGFVGTPTLAMVVDEHWGYGRWSAGSALLSTLSLNIYFILLPFVMKLGDIAALRALYNLVLPAQQLISSISPLMLVHMSQHSSHFALRKTTSMTSLAFGGFSVLYFIALAAFGDRLMSLLYSGKYSSVDHLLLIVGLYPILTSQSVVFGSALRASLHVDRVFVSYLIAIVVLLIGGMPLVFIWDLRGAVLGLLLYGISLVATLAITWRQTTCSVQ